jgi:autotransporter translocation and assembly factor TamB
VNTGTTPATLNVALKTGESSITELAKLAGGLGFGFNPAYKVAGRVSADVTAKGPATAPQLIGSIRAQGLAASGGEIKQPVSVTEIDLTLSPDSIVSNTFSTSSGSTTLSIAFTLAQYATANRSIDATVKTDGAHVGELLNIAKAYGVEATQGVTGDGSLSLDVQVKGPLGNASALAYAGTANLANMTVVSAQLKKPLTIASANAAFSQNSVALENLAATLGGTTVRGSLSAKNFAAPEVAFNLNADKIDTDELWNITAAPASNTATPGKTQTPSLLLSTTGTGNLAVGAIKASDILVKNVNAKCQLDKGVIQLSPLSTEVFGGKANGTLTMDTRQAVPQCAVKVKFAGVDANSLLSAVSSMKNTISGSLAADTNLRFSLAQGNELACTLNGAISFNLTNGLIKSLNIMNEVEKVGNLLKAGAGTDSAKGGTALKKFSGTLNILNGVASTEN